MCAIVDANVLGEVFGNNPTEAGKFFYNWLNKPRGGILTIGGTKFKAETTTNANFARVLSERIIAGRVRQVPDTDVDAEAVRINAMNIRIKSDDEHILALANVSGARLLFTNDRNLIRDFGNSDIVGGTRGRIYTTTHGHGAVRRSHRDLLRRTDLCSG